jgi:hypothetical protein
MNPITRNYIVDGIMAVSFVLCGGTGILRMYAYASWMRQVHDISGIVLVLMVLLHLILHRAWIFSMTRNFFRKKETAKPQEDEKQHE